MANDAKLGLLAGLVGVVVVAVVYQPKPAPPAAGVAPPAAVLVPRR